MKIFLSAIECGGQGKGYKGEIHDLLIERGVPMKWNLMSYYYIRGRNYSNAEEIRDHSELIMIDSGAHSFQKGKKVDWEKYTYEYADFIERFDRPNVVGYFEMDVDNIIGYDNVLKLRAILEQNCKKIIPVWHKNRGIEDFKKMCHDYSGRVVAITGWKNEDIKDEQYLMFVKYAHEHDCKIHCLGMTRRKILDKVPFDYTDSASWKHQSIFGRIGSRHVDVDYSRQKRHEVCVENYKLGVQMQEHYYQKWRKECKD